MCANGPCDTAVLLFDLDGTLTETDHLHYEAFKEALVPKGLDITLDFYKTHILGNNNTEIFKNLLPNDPVSEHETFADEKERLFREKAGTSLTPTPGLSKLLDWAEEKRIPKAIVTNAPRENSVMMLDGLGVTDRFSHVVLGGELAFGKPHPLPYLTGLEKLKGTAAASAAFEDSKAGIQAARAAGLTVFGVMSNLGAQELLGAGAHYAIGDFNDPQLWKWLEENMASRCA